MKMTTPTTDAIQLVPTAEQTARLRLVPPKLQAASDAVCVKQKEYFKRHGKYLTLAQIRSENPMVPIPEAIEVSTGVIHYSIVHSWLQAGLDRGRGRTNGDVRILNPIRDPKIQNGGAGLTLTIDNIGKIPMEANAYIDGETLVQPKKAYLLFPDEEHDGWRVIFTGKQPVEKTEPAAFESAAETTETESADTANSFAVDSMLRAVEEVLKTENLNKTQELVTSLLLNVFRQ